MIFLDKFLLKRKLKRTKVKNEIGILDKKVSAWKPFLLMLPFLLVIILFTIFPFIYAIDKAFWYNSNPNKASEVEFGLKTFELVLSDKSFQIGVRNSLIYALLSLPITLVIASVISATISSLHRKYAQGFWQTIFFLPYVTTAIAISVTFAYMFDDQIGIVNKMFGINTKWLNSGYKDSYNAIFVILVYGVWKNLAFQILILTTAMMAVDKTLYKAASIDGASGVKQFFKITLPSITKTLNFLITIGIIGGIKVFPIALFQNNVNDAVANGGTSILLYIYSQVQKGAYDIAGAATILLFILGIAFSTVLKQGIALLIKGVSKIGEKNVSNKIKTTKLPS